MSKIEWWGYLHANGDVHLKRYFGDPRDYTEDCAHNDFVQRVVPPFEADTYEQAFEILKQRLGL
jgi:hypothetical protein